MEKYRAIPKRQRRLFSPSAENEQLAQRKYEADHFRCGKWSVL